MIYLNIKELCHARGIKNPLTTLKKAGISQYVAHEYLKGEKHRFVTKHVEILCKLLRCTPNDLFVWIPDEPADDYPENPLQGIRKKPRLNLNEKLKTMTVEEIERVFGEGKS